MKILKSTILASLLALGSTNLYAAGAHSHGGSSHVHEKISETKAITIAKGMKDGLIKKGKINNAWQNIDSSKAVKKAFAKGEEWVVTFNNPQIEDKSKQTLYVFVDLYGEVTGANFTGN
jgi:hypothetical protein